MKCKRCKIKDTRVSKIGIKTYCDDCRKICSHCNKGEVIHTYDRDEIRLCKTCCQLPFLEILPSLRHKRDNPHLCPHEINHKTKCEDQGVTYYIYNCYICGSLYCDKEKDKLFIK